MSNDGRGQPLKSGLSQTLGQVRAAGTVFRHPMTRSLQPSGGRLLTRPLDGSGRRQDHDGLTVLSRNSGLLQLRT